MAFPLCFFGIIICIISFLIWKYVNDCKLIKSVTAINRGEYSERETILKLLKIGIDPRAIFHDCYIKRKSGKYTQIDLVVATKCGLIVFEIKDYSGWIFGHFKQKYWTQVLAYGNEKHRFYNPIMQNQGHIQAIRENLPNNIGIPIYSVIVYYGSSVLRDVTVSDDVFLIYPYQIKRAVSYVLSQPPALYGDKYEIMRVLKQGVANGDIDEIVCSQMYTANLASKSCPQSTYNYFFYLFKTLRRFRR